MKFTFIVSTFFLVTNIVYAQNFEPYVVLIQDVSSETLEINAEILVWTDSVCNDNPNGGPYGMFTPTSPTSG